MSETSSDGAVSSSESDYSVGDIAEDLERLQQALGESYVSTCMSQRRAARHVASLCTAVWGGG